jgi:hypothetical protein
VSITQKERFMRNPGLGNARVLMLLLPLLFAGCFGDDDQPIGPTQSQIVTVILENKDNQPAHLFSAWHSESFPCCQVAPGGDRSVKLSTQQGDDVEVSAGRNGQIISTKNCQVTVQHVSSHFLTATYRSSGWSC